MFCRVPRHNVKLLKIRDQVGWMEIIGSDMPKDFDILYIFIKGKHDLEKMDFGEQDTHMHVKEAGVQPHSTASNEELLRKTI